MPCRPRPHGEPHLSEGGGRTGRGQLDAQARGEHWREHGDALPPDGAPSTDLPPWAAIPRQKAVRGNGLSLRDSFAEKKSVELRLPPEVNLQPGGRSPIGSPPPRRAFAIDRLLRAVPRRRTARGCDGPADQAVSVGSPQGLPRVDEALDLNGRQVASRAG